MEELYTWGLQVAMAALVIALAEHLLPSSPIKQYAKIGLGLLLVSAILTPLIKLLQ